MQPFWIFFQYLRILRWRRLMAKIPLISFGNETPLWSTFFELFKIYLRFSITIPNHRADIYTQYYQIWRTFLLTTGFLRKEKFPIKQKSSTNGLIYPTNVLLAAIFAPILQLTSFYLHKAFS